MENIRQLIYVICIVAVIGELISYFIPNKSILLSLKFIITLATIISIISVYKTLGKIELNFINDTINTSAINQDLLKTEQLNYIKKNIENDLIEILNKESLTYTDINVFLIMEENEIINIECEVYSKNKNILDLKESISEKLGFKVKTFYIGE